LIALSQSLPTPNTHELLRVVTSDACGAPELLDPELFAPIAPEPLLPEGSTPLKLTTVMEDATLTGKEAVTLTEESGDRANALHISAVPAIRFERSTRAHVNPPPVTVETVVLDEAGPSVEIKAKSSSFDLDVEKADVTAVDDEFELSPNACASMASPTGAWAPTICGWSIECARMANNQSATTRPRGDRIVEKVFPNVLRFEEELGTQRDMRGNILHR
jgi:hypothetical protein